MKLKHIFTGIALLCFALSACGAKTETAEGTTSILNAEEQTVETGEVASDTGSPADADVSASSDETTATTPPYLYGC